MRTYEEIISRLKEYQSPTPSKWRERAEWRRDNRDWIHRSQEIVLRMLNSMDEQHLTQRALAERMGCTQQYVSKVLKGQKNLSLETLVKIENALDIDLLVRTHRPVEYKVEETDPLMVAED